MNGYIYLCHSQIFGSREFVDNTEVRIGKPVGVHFEINMLVDI